MGSLAGVWSRLTGFPGATLTGGVPSMPRNLKIGIEEAELVRRVLARSGLESGVMVDVGAHFGTVSILFADADWEVHAFEPDPSNRMRFRERFDERPNVTLDPRSERSTANDFSSSLRPRARESAGW